MRYQHRLQGASDEWSPPSNERSVTFAALPSGDLTFEVRAVREDGTVSAAPATLVFRRLPPVWQRGWFVTVVVAAVILSAWATVRLRFAQRRALELIRAPLPPERAGAGPSRMALTQREQEVLRSLVQGLAYKQIAATLGISVDTTRSHIKSVYRKLQVHGVAEAVSRAVREKLT